MRYLLPSVLLAVLLCMPQARAEEAPRPDDRVVFDLSAEDWVTTKTARVTVHVDAAVNGAASGTMRADMQKAVEAMAQGEWRLTQFNRGQDQTGLERWNADFEARLAENLLGGLGDNAKKQSKAGMQLSVQNIDFSPTLDETEAVRSSLRAQIYKKAADQLTALNSALPGRAYRIADIDFSSDYVAVVPQMMHARGLAMSAMAPAPASDAAPMERSEKMRVMAHVTLAALPPSLDIKH